MSARGFKYKLQSSKQIPKQSLVSMLKNRFYTGLYTFANLPKVIKGKHSPIISEELFESVQKLFQSSSYTRHNSLYSNMIGCGCCGKKLVNDITTKANGKQYVYYRCISKNCKEKISLTEKNIDDSVKSYLKQIRLDLIPQKLVQEFFIEQIWSQNQDLTIKKRKKSRKYHAKLRKTEFIEKNQITDKEYIRNSYAEVEEQYGDIDGKISNLKYKISMIKGNINQLVNDKCYDRYMKLPLEAKQALLKLLANTIKTTNSDDKMTFKPAFIKIRRR